MVFRPTLWFGRHLPPTSLSLFSSASTNHIGMGGFICLFYFVLNIGVHVLCNMFVLSSYWSLFSSIQLAVKKALSPVQLILILVQDNFNVPVLSFFWSFLFFFFSYCPQTTEGSKNKNIRWNPIINAGWFAEDKITKSWTSPFSSSPHGDSNGLTFIGQM